MRGGCEKGVRRYSPKGFCCSRYVGMYVVVVTCNSKKHGDGYSWDYGGSKNPGEIVSCPKCGYKVRIPENE